MAEQIVQNGILLFNEFDMSGDLNAIALNETENIQENTSFGDTYITRLAGLRTSSIALDGYFEGTPDGEFNSTMASNSSVISVLPTGGTEGDTGWIMQPAMAEYSPGASVGEMFSFNVNAEAHGPLVRGIVMANKTVTSSDTGGNQSAHQVGAISSGQTMYAALHITGVSGTSPHLNIYVYSATDSGFGSNTLRFSFDLGAGVTSTQGKLITYTTATTDEWWRVHWIGISGTSPTFDVVITMGVV